MSDETCSEILEMHSTCRLEALGLPIKKCLVIRLPCALLEITIIFCNILPHNIEPTALAAVHLPVWMAKILYSKYRILKNQFQLSTGEDNSLQDIRTCHSAVYRDLDFKS
jgi:hypothetical protein